MTKALERFLRYVAVETTSKPDAGRVPSTECQFDLARMLAGELRELGLSGVALDEHCYVTATLPANSATKCTPVIGWIAHLDTSPDVSGKDVRPRLVEYESGEITLESGLVIPEDEALKSCRGHRIVTTDGTTLLGADDKAGVAAIMTALERLQAENRPHGTIRVCFTPDEEVGNGTAFFDLEAFGADAAYTVDGELPGELNRETFTARLATVTVTGKEIHPGTAKGVMVNALRVASEIVARLPKNEVPETTEGRESFLHPYSFTGDVGRAVVRILLRGFSDEELDRLERILRAAADDALALFPGVSIETVVKEQYRNMDERLRDRPEILDRLEEAARRAGTSPYWKPIRGGTDGSRLTEMGLPTPSIFTGGHHFHSPMEWLSVEYLETTVETLVQLATVWTEGGES